MKDEGRKLKDEGFKVFRGFADRQPDGQTDICECRVAFATENQRIVLCNQGTFIQELKCQTPLCL